MTQQLQEALDRTLVVPQAWVQPKDPTPGYRAVSKSLHKALRQAQGERAGGCIRSW